MTDEGESWLEPPATLLELPAAAAVTLGWLLLTINSPSDVAVTHVQGSPWLMVGFTDPGDDERASRYAILLSTGKAHRVMANGAVEDDPVGE